MNISVIIPAYNQAERLFLTLHSFACQTCDPRSFEVIVVDDGSEDDTQAVVQSFLAPYQLEYIDQPNQGRAVARNRGVHKATGELLIFNDCDRAADCNFIKAHFSRHKNQSNIAVMGSIYEFFFSDLLSRHEELFADIAQGFLKFSRFAREYPYAKTVFQMYDPEGTTSYNIPWISFLSGNVSLSRQAFEQVGGFDEAFIDWGFEHFELGFRLFKAGLQYIYEPGARNYHFAHQRETDFYPTKLRKSFNYLKFKHPVYAVELLEDFYKGKLSLQDYEYHVCGKYPELNDLPPIYLPQSVRVDF